MNHIQITNWDKWQTYRKDRGQPPWIKVHRRLLRNEEWVDLTDSERGQLVAMWLLAADHDGLIPASPQKIQKLCFMTEPPNLNKFISLGFMTSDGSHIDVNMTSNGSQDGAPKAEADKNRKEYSLIFEQNFWKYYPKKNAKKKAFAIWKKIPDIILISKSFPDIIQKQKDYKASLKKVGEFAPEFPDPERWIKDERWNDEIPELENQSPDSNLCKRCGKRPWAIGDLCRQCDVEVNKPDGGVSYTEYQSKIGGLVDKSFEELPEPDQGKEAETGRKLQEQKKLLQKKGEQKENVPDDDVPD